MSRVQGNACGTATIYYLHPRLAGSLAGWKHHFEHAAALGFSHVCVGPIFVPSANGDIFLVDDYEETDPAIAAGQAADATTQRLAELGRDNGLQLLLDLVLDRVATDGAMARSAPHWFYRNAGADVVDPRREQLG